MSSHLLFWIYLINAMILIIHEIDSAYWQEWKLINPNDKNGINGFLILHFPVIFIILIGLVLVYEQKPAGIIFSLILSAGGLFAFFFHFYHLQKGRPEFNTIISKALIISTLIVSLFQAYITIEQMVTKTLS
jgi:uncharacterized membrane protein